MLLFWQVELNEDGRYWHIACSYFPQPTQSSEGQIIIYGGAKQDKSTEHVSFIGQRGLTILVFGMFILIQTLLKFETIDFFMIFFIRS